ncbi:MAG TPA: hypothetical protein VF037_04080 [Gemmatimonadales bacterium]
MHRPIAALSVMAAAACSTGLETNLDGEVTLQLAAVNSAAPASAAPQQIELGSDVIVLQKVELVLKEIELDGDDDACAGADSASTDGCAEFETGPMIVELPLDGSSAHGITAQVAAGTYDEIEFEIHRPDDDTEADLAFLAQHPEFEDISIRVTGTWNGEPFVYVSRRGYEQEIEFATPFVMAEGAADLTLQVDVGRWFVNVAGTGLVDPRLALEGQAFDALVDANIEASFDAFSTDDSSGHSSDDSSGHSTDD